MSSPQLNLFITFLTNPQPTINYCGDSAGEGNRKSLQKLEFDDCEHAIISSAAIRNAAREGLAKKGLPCNRSRVHDANQLAIAYKEFIDAEKWADDFLFGGMVCDKVVVKENPNKLAKITSFLRTNIALATTPWAGGTNTMQSPKMVGRDGEKPPWANAAESALVVQEIDRAAFQFVAALPFGDCPDLKRLGWAVSLLETLGELSNVAGGHTRSYFDMEPASFVARLTRRPVPGFNTYGFDAAGGFADLSRIEKDDLPGGEFWVAGKIVRDMEKAEVDRLMNEGVKLHKSPQALLSVLGARARELVADSLGKKA